MEKFERECVTMELDGKTVIGAGIVLFVIVVGIWYMFLR